MNYWNLWKDRLINIQFIFFSRMYSQKIYCNTYIYAIFCDLYAVYLWLWVLSSISSLSIMLEWGMGTGCWLLFIRHYLFFKHTNCRNDPPVLKKLFQGYNFDRVVVCYWEICFMSHSFLDWIEQAEFVLPVLNCQSAHDMSGIMSNRLVSFYQNLSLTWFIFIVYLILWWDLLCYLPNK